MKSILHTQRRSSILAAAVTILLGLALLFWPDRSVELLCILLGAAILVTGVIYIAGWISDHRAQGRPAFFLLPGVILCALGLWLVTSPDSVVRFIQYIFGAVLLFHGILDVQGAASLIRLGHNGWWLDLALAALTIALGALILINPFGTFAALVMLMGLSLVFDGISDLYLIWRLSRAFSALDGGED